MLSFTQFKDFSEKGIIESSTQLGLDQIKNHLELSGRVIVGNLNDANSKLIKVTSKFQNQNWGLKDLNPSYIPLDKINKTSSINEIMQEINAKFPQIDISLIKEIGKDLYNKLQRNINPIDFTLSNDLGSIPISIMNKLIDLNLIELSDPTKNAIKKLVDEDIEKWLPFELPLSQIPRSFCICDKFGHQIGRTTGEVIDILKDLNLKPENLNNQDIIDELNKFRINIKDPISLSEITPSILIKLKENGIISLDADWEKLIQSTIDTGVNYFKPLNAIINSRENSIDELNRNFDSKLPDDINFESLKNELDKVEISFEELKAFSPSTFSNIINKLKINPNSKVLRASQLTSSQILELEDKLLKLTPNMKEKLNKLNEIIKPQKQAKVNYDKVQDFIRSSHQSFKKLIDQLKQISFKGIVNF